MKNILFLLLGCILFSCQSSHDKTTENQITGTGTEKNVDTLNNFNTVQLKLNTTTPFQHKYFGVDDSLFFGFKEIITDVSLGDDLGYVVFTKDNGFHVALVKYENRRLKVIGITNIPNLKGKEEFVQGRYPESIRKFTTFGVVEVNEGKVKTIRAWRINNKNKCLEQISPATVDFADSYNTDTD